MMILLITYIVISVLAFMTEAEQNSFYEPTLSEVVNDRGRRNLGGYTGNMITLGVRVKYAEGNNVTDTDTDDDDDDYYDLDDLNRAIFDENSPSLKSQMKACSNGKVTIEEFAGVTDGVMDVTITRQNSQRKDVNEAQNAVSAKLGKSWKRTDIRYLILGLPSNSGNGNWNAAAAQNGKMSFYRGIQVLYVSYLMHEVGHNFGFSHSGSEIPGTNKDIYADETGLMGFGMENNDIPRSCYNPSKSYDSTWYERVDLSDMLASNDSFDECVRIVGVGEVADFPNEYVVIKFGKYYIGYNKAVGPHSETRDDKNMVTVVTQEEEFRQSFKVAVLGDSDTFCVANLADISVTIDASSKQCTVCIKSITSCPAKVPAPSPRRPRERKQNKSKKSKNQNSRINTIVIE